ncbi:WD repeat-containing and planar cell polarity effector protein fritz isoform X1 [Ostrinia furnacalis]|uniref:WD repeat-containing and planar cell polarity effector protein fritz isoform X1 n=1 Tax=Ostrinia furnacalis TaxID=93504 RepID=UPI00103C167E|nr:WD repeat-containing and planar cell polarity effector protein fritz isoform X1 [Ostrinia furnacalis]
MFNYNIKFLTCDETLHLKNGDFKSYKYDTRKRTDESVYDVGKRTFCERRGSHWRSPNHRQIRQLESKLRDRNIISCEWTTESLITLVFSSGAIAYLTVKPETLDVTQLLFDRYCVGKLSGQTVTGVVISQTHLMFTHADKMATLIMFGRNAGNRLPCRISDRDPHVQTIELGGGGRRSERRMSWCEFNSGLKVLVWSTSNAEPAPWSPIVEDHANLHLYRMNGQQISLVAYHQLENETLLAELSNKSDSVIHIIDQITCHKNGVSLEWLRYDVPNSEERALKLSSLRESVTRVSLPAPARSVRRSPCDIKLLTACIDGSLHVIHNTVGVTHSVRAGFIATEVRWAGELIVATEEGGRMQCFDRALSLLHHHTKCFDLTSYLRDAKRTQILATREAKGGPLVLVSFSGGPLALLHITHPRLLTAWLRNGRSSNAVALLRALDWDKDGMDCLWAVNKLVCAALRSGNEALSEEGVAQSALGAYLAPRAPLPAGAARYAPPLHDLARKFFHHLLRRGRIEKALSLAVDLRAWDLFADARWAAARKNLPHLADEAAALADHYAGEGRPDSECSESCSQCSSHSYSDDETSASSEVKTKPPPLPRVSIPTVMPVPINHSEPPTAHSIRPNLHQYLERDNTIWNTNVDDTYLKVNQEKIKPILTHSVRWHSVDNMLNTRQNSLHTLASISEVVTKPASSIVDIIPRVQDDRMTSHFRSVYQTELREEAPMYRYHNNFHASALNNRTHKFDADRTGNRSTEKNKVKFSDTVTIAVVSEPPHPPLAREAGAGLTRRAGNNAAAAERPPKIKVVHFGMV